MANFIWPIARVKEREKNKAERVLLYLQDKEKYSVNDWCCLCCLHIPDVGDGMSYTYSRIKRGLFYKKKTKERVSNTDYSKK